MATGTGINPSVAVLASTLNSIVLKHIEPTVFDQVMKATPVFYRFWKKGQVIAGGASLMWPVMTSAKQYGGWYVGAQQMMRGPEDIIQPAEVEWKHVYEDITIPYTDVLRASSSHAVVNLVRTLFDAGIMNLRGRISRALFNKTTASETPNLALDHFFKAVDAGGTAINSRDGYQVAGFSDYAGISHSYVYWQGQVLDKYSSGSETAVTLGELQTLYGQCSDGNEMPTLGIFTQAGFNFLWSSLQAQQRWMGDDEMARAGFMALKFNNASIVVDNNMPAGCGLFINENWVDLVSHAGDNFVIDPITFSSPTERTMNTKICWSGNLRVKILKFNGKLIRASNF